MFFVVLLLAAAVTAVVARVMWASFSAAPATTTTDQAPTQPAFRFQSLASLAGEPAVSIASSPGMGHN
jgi:hypothetical protein